MEQRSRYEYQPLTSSHEIRLIILKRNKTSSPLKCRIVHVELPLELSYLALSYTWGASSPLKPLLVDGQELHIRTNLWWALWHLREDMRMSSKGHEIRSFPKYMWIDAICINQDDIAERNHQVRLISNIFSDASEVLAWLGIETDDSRLAMEALQGVCEPHSWPEALRAVSGLLNREYWTRMWIIQEIGLANKITLQCGGQNVDWGSIECLQNERYLDPGTEVEMTRIYESHAMRLFRQWSNQKQDDSPRPWQSYEKHGESLQGLLETFRDSKCSDPRDKVFALIGLANDCQHNELLPDYSKSTIDVYIEAIYHCNITTTEYSTRRFISFSRMLFDSLGLQSVDQNVIERALESESSAMKPLLQAMFYGSHYIQDTSPSFEIQSLKSTLKVECISSGQSHTDPSHLRSFPDLVTTPLYMEKYQPDDQGENEWVRWIRLENGLYGLAPACAAKGDAVCRLPQWHVAAVLRKCHHTQPRYYKPVATYTLHGRALILPRGSTLDTNSSEVLVRICIDRDEKLGDPEDMFSWPIITFLDIATLYKLIT